MSGALRYSRPAVCDHLARQYVAGDLHPLVRRRMERLLPLHTPLQEAVERWADHLYPLQHGLPEARPPAFVWRRIAQSIAPGGNGNHTVNTGGTPARPTGVLLYQWLTAISLSLVVGLAVLLFRPSDVPEVQNPAYLAPLSQQDAVTLVLYGFARSEQAAPELRLQWARTYHPRPEGELHLWAELAVTGEWHYLGDLTPNMEQIELSDHDWQRLSASSRLLVTSSTQPQDWTQLVMAGPCIQMDYGSAADAWSSAAGHGRTSSALAALAAAPDRLLNLN